VLALDACTRKTTEASGGGMQKLATRCHKHSLVALHLGLGGIRPCTPRSKPGWRTARAVAAARQSGTLEQARTTQRLTTAED